VIKIFSLSEYESTSDRVCVCAYVFCAFKRSQYVNNVLNKKLKIFNLNANAEFIERENISNKVCLFYAIFFLFQFFCVEANHLCIFSYSSSINFLLQKWSSILNRMRKQWETKTIKEISFSILFVTYVVW